VFKIDIAGRKKLKNNVIRRAHYMSARKQKQKYLNYLLNNLKVINAL
jgi:2-phosphoglycerate kinase